MRLILLDFNMFFLTSIIIIAFISVILAFWSLRNLEKKPKAKEFKKKLDKRRVIFHAHKSSSS